MALVWVYPVPMELLETLPEAGGGAEADERDVARFRDGEAAAFERLVFRHEREVYRLVLRLLRNPDDALEVAQEAFLRAYRGLPSFRGEASFRTWLYGIALNAARTRQATLSRHLSRTESLEGGEDDPPSPLLSISDPGPSPESRALGGELKEALLAALSRISPEHREILLLREVEGLDYEEVALLLGIPAGTVKSRLARARRAVREAMEGIWP
ncbi:MAG: RNA polymerase sigma factor [Acidobacteriota bacterium]